MQPKGAAAASNIQQRAPHEKKLSWNQIEETYFKQQSKVQLLHQLADLHPFAGQLPTANANNKNESKAANTRGQSAEEGGTGSKRAASDAF